MKTTIAGIPCEVRAVTLFVTKGNYSPQAETPDEYFGARDIEFDVYDRKGYPAAWLEAKMTEEDRWRIEDELIEEAKQEEYDE